MLGKHGKQMSEAPTIATIEEEEDHFESPDEGTSKKRRRIFEDGYNDADEEDELEGDKEEEILEDEDQDTISDDSSSSEDTIQHESPIVQKKNNKKAVSDLVPFKLNFAIPLNGADEIVSLLSNISWKDFRSQLADTLGIAPKSVAVAYRFSTSPTSARYVHLKSTEHLTELFQTAKKTLKTSRSQKPFYVTIKDLRDEPGKKGKQSKGRKNKKPRKDTDSERSGSDSDDGTTRVNGKNVSSKEKSGPQWVAQIEKDNACADHPGHACVKTLPNGHHQLTKSELSLWAIFLQKGYPSTTAPPQHLKLEDAPSKTRATGAPTTSTPQPQPAPQPQVPFGHAPFMGYPGSFGYSPFAPFPSYPGQHMGQHYHAQGSPPSMSQHRHVQSSPPSMGQHRTGQSSPPSELDDVKLYPCIREWLQEQDNGEV
ncbi:hypothetical protein BYT27DRAFT_7238900 [Phlegmacium glaucopus]|nr:hypothetical protein BYT27DRAFT_7179417 [Phlegmacium glaucopus]KAF8814278.1 hypothetical protein BYT27DRAFT_7238900 [Phlegmacium glaucopus]